MDKDSLNIVSIWERHHKSTIFKNREKDPQGLDIVCVSGYPLAYNNMLNFFQLKAMDTVVKKIKQSGGTIMGSAVLDEGCGTGRWCSYFNKKDAQVTGTDISQFRLDDNKKRYPSITFKKMQVDNLLFKDNSFNIINVSWVLQHNPHAVQEKAIDEMFRVLKKGGYICFMEGCHENKDTTPQFSFPRTSSEWKSLFEKRGGEILYHRKILQTFLPDIYVKYRNKVRVCLRSALGLGGGSERKLTDEEVYKNLENKQAEKKYKVLRTLFQIFDQAALIILSYISYPVEFLNSLLKYYSEATLVMLVRKK